MSEGTRATMAYEFSSKKNYSQKYTLPEKGLSGNSAAELVKRSAKVKETISKIKKINRNSSNNQDVPPLGDAENKENVRVEPLIVPATNGDGQMDDHYPTIERVVDQPSSSDEEEEEDTSMDEVNRRLTETLISLPEQERNLFKVTLHHFDHPENGVKTCRLGFYTVVVDYKSHLMFLIRATKWIL